VFILITISCSDENDDSTCYDESLTNENPCTAEYMPVCGCDDITYGNSCEASNNGILLWDEGPCN
jgi:hypothetical protein